MVPGVGGSNPLIHPEKSQVSHCQELGISYISPAPKSDPVCAKFDLNKLPSEAEAKETQHYTLREAVDYALDLKKPALWKNRTH